jgi:hypothetical protein
MNYILGQEEKKIRTNPGRADHAAAEGSFR